MELNIEAAKKFICRTADLIAAQKEYLLELDSILGDGDLGLTMDAGFTAARKVTEEYSEADIGKFFTKIGLSIAKAAPSSMGTLVASAFMKAGKAVTGKDALSATDLAAFCNGIAAGIMERGKCRPGGRTIVDAVYPAAEAAKNAADAGRDIQFVAKAAFEAAGKGVEATKTMEPTIGKALYHKDKASGLPDQGAVVGQVIYQGLLESLS